MDKILVFSRNEEMNRRIKIILNDNFDVLFTYFDIYNYVSQINRHKPNLIILLSSSLDFNLLSKMISSNLAILLIRDSEFNISGFENLENFYKIDKNKIDSLLDISKIIIKDYKNIIDLKKKNEEFKARAEEERLMKHAKLELMKQGISEEEAYKFILQSSMKKRMSKKDICMQILNE